MKTIYDVMTQAIDGIDEKYLEKTAECLSVPKKASKRSVIINSEELVEMKDKSKKSDFIAKIVAVAAAFVCVIAVFVFLIVNNNNKVPVLGNMESVLSGAEESSDESYTHPRDEHHRYGYNIGYRGDIPTEYNGKELTLDIEMTNIGEDIKYTYFV